MGASTAIAWTGHTFNPWWGCEKVSPGCDNCYAEAFAKRTGHQVWGKTAGRRFFGDKHWAEPRKWSGRVFCASMADVFEPLDIGPQQFQAHSAGGRHGSGSEGYGMKLGDRVLITGKDHPWLHSSGEVVEDKGDGLVVARLDNGMEVFAWPRQYRVLGGIPTDRKGADNA